MGRSNSDERYIIDICDKVLGRKASRQHRFYFLRGDSRIPTASGHKLPVDAYYDDLKLVIEYHERQHTEAVGIMDRRMTVSGISRGEQRTKYDQRRHEELPKHGLTLIILDYANFDIGHGKRLRRNLTTDESKIRDRLSKFVVST
ncbi:MAG: hypothetical protein M3O03_04055 [Pseudomonadota bacterium]|nr:hypothetical protein [Pseudomonadota bacterium]